MTPIDREDLNRRDLEAHAKTIGELTTSIIEIKKEIAVKEVRDEMESEQADERFSRLEKRVDAIFNLGIWILAAFGGSFVALVANFVFKGGLIVGK